MKYKNIVLPDYKHCILGTITSILKYYNVETKHSSSKILDELLSDKKYKNVVFIVLDGMGESILNNASKNGYFKKNEVDCVTSVYPSTTTAALTSYYSGKTPYETGWIAWSQYFKEYGRCFDMFSKKESYFGETLNNPIKDVFKTELNYKNIFYQIEEASPNVKTYEIEPEYAERRAKRRIVADDINQLVDGIIDTCSIPGEKFVFAYSDDPDATLHKYGVDSSEVKEYIKTAEKKIEDMYKILGDDTIVIISADHGHKDVNHAYTLLDYPDIYECLLMPPSFESRAVNFWIRPDMKDIFEERFNKEFGKEFWLMTKEEFLNEYKFLGTGEKHHKIDDFVGDYIALSVSDSIIKIESFLTEVKPVKKSTHCGLSKEEMEVPLIVLKK